MSVRLALRHEEEGRVVRKLARMREIGLWGKGHVIVGRNWILISRVGLLLTINHFLIEFSLSIELRSFSFWLSPNRDRRFNFALQLLQPLLQFLVFPHQYLFLLASLVFYYPF